MRSVVSLLRSYLFLLPLSAVATFYLVLATPFTAHAPADLRHARFGWPFAWIEQDLSRYGSIRYPSTVRFDWVRAWDDPIDTTYRLPVFVVDTLTVGIGVATLFLLAMIPVRRLATTRRTSSATPRRSRPLRGADAISSRAATVRLSPEQCACSER